MKQLLKLELELESVLIGENQFPVFMAIQGAEGISISVILILEELDSPQGFPPEFLAYFIGCFLLLKYE